MHQAIDVQEEVLKRKNNAQRTFLFKTIVCPQVSQTFVKTHDRHVIS